MVKSSKASNSPPFKGKIHPLPITLLEPESQAAESFKLLGVKILSINSGLRSRVVMVTSPQPFDGKSTVAANLAVAIAQELNKYALLLDCDLRRPCLHQVFGLQASKGIHEYLADGSSVTSYLLKTPVKNLTLLPGGSPSSNPSKLLSSDKMRLLIEELRNHYQDRYIIADLPPVGFSVDTSLLSNIVDSVLLVARSGKTPKKMIREAVARIGRDRLLGVVFNEDGEAHKSYHDYYRYYRKGRRE
jgi:capsular exopolysaccharide synthesis family protein